MTGKGDSPRPLSVSDEQYRANYDAIDWSDARRTEEQQAALKKAWGSDAILGQFDKAESDDR